MAVKNTGKKPTSNNTNAKRTNEALVREAKRRQIWSIVLFALGILLLIFAFIGNSNAENPNGADFVHMFLCGMLGVAVFIVGPIIIYIAVILSANKIKGTVREKLVQLCITTLLICAAMHIFFGIGGENFSEIIANAYDSGKLLKGGGFLGLIFGMPLLLFGEIAAKIIIILIIFVFIMLTANISLIAFLKALSFPFKKLGLFVKNKHTEYLEESEILRLESMNSADKGGTVQPNNLHKSNKQISPVSQIQSDKEADDADKRKLKKARSLATIEAAANIVSSPQEPGPLAEEIKAILNDDTGDGPYSPEISTANRNAVFEAIESFKNEEIAERVEKIENEQTVMSLENAETITEEEVASTDGYASDEPESGELLYAVADEQYTLPPITLLNDIVLEKSEEDIAAELESNSVTLVDTLKSFGVQTKIVGVCRGPSVTRYELQPAPGVKIASITKLVDDLALNLATAGVRIEAPIPNKAAVGIEVPNRKVDTVPFRAMVDSKTFTDTDSKLGAVLGRDISGSIIIADVAKMPHLLIAGTTGSGKSVCVNSIIMSILFRSTPDEVRLLMIDPKAVEFMIYNGIPHLLIPVVTDPKKAAGALSWAVTEMLNRYKMFADNNVRDLNGYNSLCKGDAELKPMPQIVIFIDELADLMMASPGEVESSICRLAQMARAAGMHLVIATQRPSVNVVTGVIKANIPSRIALKVASQVDSRTIIDSAGAEKLLGKGDMLYFPVGIPKPMRVQGCWVSDKEVERVVSFIKNSFVLKYDEKVIEEVERQAEAVADGKGKNDNNSSGSVDSSDEKLEEAIEAVIEAGQASTSYLQRKLGLGYGRAAKLIDIMEQMGVVGEFKGSKPRDILMSKQDWYERKMNQN